MSQAAAVNCPACGTLLSATGPDDSALLVAACPIDGTTVEAMPPAFGAQYRYGQAGVPSNAPAPVIGHAGPRGIVGWSESVKRTVKKAQLDKDAANYKGDTLRGGNVESVLPLSATSAAGSGAAIAPIQEEVAPEPFVWPSSERGTTRGRSSR